MGAAAKEAIVRFLVVEDEEIASRALRRLLAPYGEMVLAPTARAASSILATPDHWTAFFFDVGLPDGSGIDVLAQARIEHPTTPAMVLSGCLEPGAINAAFDLDADCVAKPVQKSRLVRFLLANGDFAVRLERAVEAWRERYGLSEAEADVLGRAAAGETRESMAEARESSPLTIKAHVARLLHKTGDDSLFGVVSRLLRGMAGEAPWN
jgi:DNA-binding NarL/FixJ family response regulator